MSTKVVHIEVAEDFTSRRGHCATLQSDQGTNFVGADKELVRLFTEATAVVGKLQ